MKILTISLLIAVNIANAQVLKSFEDDGCTMYPDGTRDRPNLWYKCCLEHDLRYYIGGDKFDQKISDLKLKQCVNNVAGSFQAKLMYLGIRLGHFSPIKSKYRWAWGWRHDKSFESLTIDEIRAAREAILQLPIDEKVKLKFISENLSSTMTNY